MRTIATRFTTFCFLACIVLTGSAHGRIEWVSDWREAREQAQSQQRLVLLHFYSQNCPPCQRLERNVFPRPEVGRAMGSGYIAVKIDVDQQPELAKFYRVNQWPTDVIVDPRGKEVYRSSPTPQDPNRFISMLDEVRAHYHVGRQATPQSREPAQVASRPSGAAAQPSLSSRVPQESFPNPSALNGNQPEFSSSPRQSPSRDHSVPGDLPYGGESVAARGRTNAGGDFVTPGFPGAAGSDASQSTASQTTDLARRPVESASSPNAQFVSGQPSAYNASPALTTTNPQAESGLSAYPPQPAPGSLDRGQALPANSNGQGGAGPVRQDNAFAPGAIVTNNFVQGAESTPSGGNYDPRSAFPMQQGPMNNSNGQFVPTASYPVGNDPAAAYGPTGATPTANGPGNINFSPVSMPSQGAPGSLGTASAQPAPSGTAYGPSAPAVAEQSLPPNCAMEGYCAVTLVLMNEWARGDRQWGAEHEGRVYLFTSREFRDQFLADPYRFAPVLGGFDPVRYLETGQLVDGKRKHGVFYANTIYLFSDEVSLTRFSKQPDLFAAQLRQALVANRATTGPVR
jgi:thioredoxin-related protein